LNVSGNQINDDELLVAILPCFSKIEKLCGIETINLQNILKIGFTKIIEIIKKMDQPVNI